MEFKSLEVKNLSKKYHDESVLSDIQFNLNAGEICAVIGKNGAGKSTLFKLFTQQVTPDTGEIVYLNEREKVELTIGAIIEGPRFFANFTAFENLSYFFIQKYGKVDKEAILKVLEIVDLPNSNMQFSNFSLGMKQRLGIGLSLLFHPDLLILDEPVNGLDPEGIRDIRKTLQEINQKNGTTIIISSHILTELEELATDYIFLDNGRIVEKISKIELMKKLKDYLEIEIDKVDEAKHILEQSFPHMNVSIENHKLQVTNYDGKNAEINKKLVENGVDVYTINVHKMSLEDYFLRKVGK